MTDARRVTLSADGTGTATIRGVYPGQDRVVSQVEVELTDPGAGTVTLYHDSREIATVRLALRVVANGEVILHQGRQLDATVTEGPASAVVIVRFHYIDRPGE